MAQVQELQGVRFAALGLAAMFNPGGAVRSCSLRPAEAAARDAPWGHEEAEQAGLSAAVAAQLDVRGAGRLLLYASRRPQQCVLQGQSVSFAWDAGALTLELSAGHAIARKLLVLW